MRSSRVAVPTIVRVVVRNAAVKYVVVAGGELAGKAVCVLITGVRVVEGRAVENEVVVRPKLSGVS